MLRTEAALRHAVKGAIVSLAACLLSACAFQSDVCGKEPTGKLTYYIASVREKKIQGNWGEHAQSVQRQETADGRWALEILCLGGFYEGHADVKVLDSAGAVVWEGRTGDGIVMSPVAPAFAASSSMGGGLEIYNLQIGPTPIFTVPPSSEAGAHLSRDGTVFGVAAENVITIVTLRGEVLGRIPAPDSLRGVSIAIADSGRYVAFGGTDPWVPASASADAVPVDSFPTPRRLMIPRGPDRRPMQNRRDSAMATVPMTPVLPITWANPRVVILDRTGRVEGTIHLQRGLPQSIAFSVDDPPGVAVATGERVSLWTFAGKRIWEDSVTLGRTGRSLNSALRVSNSGHVLAVMAGSMSDAAIYVWRGEGVFDSVIVLPVDLNPPPDRCTWPTSGDSCVLIQGESTVVIVCGSSSGN